MLKIKAYVEENSLPIKIKSYVLHNFFFQFPLDKIILKYFVDKRKQTVC